MRTSYRQRIAAAVVCLAAVPPIAAQVNPAEPAAPLQRKTPQAAPDTTPPVEYYEVHSDEDRLVLWDGGKPSVTGWVGLVGVLVVLATLTLIASRLAGRGGGKHAAAVAEVLARSNLTGKHQILLVRAGRSLLYVAVGASGVSTLREVTDREEIAELLAGVTGGDAFANILKRKRVELEESLKGTSEGSRRQMQETAEKIRSWLYEQEGGK